MSNEIAAEWGSTTLKEAAGGLFTDGDWVESKDQDPDGEVRLIQLADIGDGSFLDKSARFLTADKAQELRCTFLQPGDLLIARMADPIARCCLFPGIDQPAATVVDVSIVRPGPDVDREYLAYAISNPVFRSEALGSASGTTRSRISRSNLGAISLPRPPLDEQRRIAEVLRLVDEAIAANNATLQQSEVALAAISVELFEAALSQDGNAWPQHALEDMLDNIIDYRGVPPPKADSGIPLLTAKNVRFGYLDFEPREYIAEEDYIGWMRRGLPKAGDIMFTTEAPLGNVAEFPGIKAALGQRTLTLVPNARILDAKFLKWLLLSRPAQDLIWSYATGSTAKGIKQRTFRKLKFGFPALDEQVRIAKVLEDIGEARDGAKRASEAYAVMKVHLLSDLLSGRVRVPA